MTRLFDILLAVEMVVAVLVFHWPNGTFVASNGGGGAPPGRGQLWTGVDRFLRPGR